MCLSSGRGAKVFGLRERMFRSWAYVLSSERPREGGDCGAGTTGEAMGDARSGDARPGDAIGGC